MVSVTELISLLLLLLALGFFARLAYRAKSVSSLQFQLLIFVVILDIAEIPHILDEIGLIEIGPYETLGLFIHTLSMVVLAVAVAYRFYKLVKTKDG